MKHDKDARDRAKADDHRSKKENENVAIDFGHDDRAGDMVFGDESDHRTIGKNEPA